MQMSSLPVNKVYMDRHTPDENSTYEFAIDCGAVYFGAVYDQDGSLLTVDQYFYSDAFSQSDMDDAAAEQDLLSVDESDFPAKTYLLKKTINGNEWLRFHAVVPLEIDPDYFHQKYLGE